MWRGGQYALRCSGRSVRTKVGVDAVIHGHDIGDLADNRGFETVGTQMGRYRNRLARGGRMVSISFKPVARGLATIAGSVIHGSRRIRTFSGNPTRALLDDYSTYITAGQVHALIAGRYELDDLAAAHRAAEVGGSPGKHVITLH